jgi:trans-aconitate methyltransferase
MKLLSEKELAWSDVVANNSMNRKRRASGINSYEKELHFKPEDYLNTCLQQKGHVKWLDLCCGEGNALLQYAKELFDKGHQEKAVLKGIDLVDHFQPIPANIHCLQFDMQSLTDWIPDDRYDLITCVHGLHYIGDKLKLLSKAISAINDGGIMLANIDLKNIKVEGDPNHTYLKSLLKSAYNSRRKMLICKGPQSLSIDLAYKGADDKAGPNYTGQNVVDSYYDKIAY